MQSGLQGSCHDVQMQPDEGPMRIPFINRLLVMVLGAVPGAGFAQTLDEAVAIALAQYPTILASQARVNAADHSIMSARSGHFPQVSWQGTNSVYSNSNMPTMPFQPNDTWIQSPAVTVNIWSGWRIQSGVERAQAVLDSRRHEQRITRDEVAFLVIEAYLNWVRSAELVRISQSNLAAHERLRRDIVKIAAVDQGRLIDVEQADVRVESARLSLQQRQSEHEIFGLRLSRMLLGPLPARPSGFDQIKGVLPTTREQALASLTDTHPIIAQQQAQIEAAQSSVREARAGFSPKVDFSYQKQTAPGFGQGDYVAQLNLSVPIFDGGAALGSTRSAQSSLEAAQQDLAEARITLRERLLSTWAEYQSAIQRVSVGERQVVTAKKLVQGYDQQFRVGRRSLLDLLTIHDNLYTYETQANNARFEELIARARLLAVLNRLASAYQGTDATAAPRAKEGSLSK